MCPTTWNKTRILYFWDIPDPKHQSEERIREIRGLIKKKVITYFELDRALPR